MEQFGLDHLWTNADVVQKAVAILLVIMSAMSWYVIAFKSWSLIRLQKVAASAREAFWQSRSIAEGMEALGEDDTPFRTLAQAGLDCSQHHRHHEGTLGGAMGRSEWMASGLRASIDESAAKMQSGMSILASVSSTAPFVGLFGTVWGIMNSFIGISKAQTTNLAVVAPGIAEATVIVGHGPRVRALAMRLSAHDGKWRVEALEIG